LFVVIAVSLLVSWIVAVLFTDRKGSILSPAVAAEAADGGEKATLAVLRKGGDLALQTAPTKPA
jgi:multidrug efflux pump subunit AcrB